VARRGGAGVCARRLRAPWTPAAAADWIFALTHVDTWQHLGVEAGWMPALAIEHIVQVLRGQIVASR